MSKFKALLFFTTLLLISALLLIAINQTQKKLDRSIRQHNLYFTGQIYNAPPIVVFTTVALGSFRGLLADALWFRSSSLQEDGNYFEMKQLADWITELQPRFSGATAYLAWNMAYNISVTCSDREDRWRWIQAGIELIRNKAIVYNPSDPLLYKELGWIFQHKMGNVLDDYNLYYKNRLAIEMEQVFGTNPDWQLLASAPRDNENLLRMLPDSKKFLDLLEKSKYKSLDQLFTDFKKQSKLPDDFVALIDSPRIAGILDNYFRSLWLRTSFKLDPVLIEKINDKYGWLDWRTPEAQAVYWATMGLISQIKGMSLEAAKIAYWKDPIQGRDLACERMITQALKESFASGKILWVDRENYQNIIMVPNLKVVDAVNKVFEEAYKNNPGVESFRSARLNFIQEAIMLLFNFGNFTKAAEYYKMLQREEPGSHKKSLEAFVMEQWAEEVRTASVKRATEVISGLIYRSCYFLAYGDDDAALASEKMARYIYNTYQLQNSDIKERVGLAAYKEIKKAVVTNCIKSLPPVLGEVLKARLQEDVLKKKEEDKEAAEKKK